MIAFCGVYKALEDVGLIDCLTYTSALSGSSWYLATLYSHPDFPHEPKVSHKIKPEIRSCVEKYWQVHLSPPWSSKYLKKIIAKGLKGQPVSFTDFYGYLVGQQLLKGRMKARLSDQAEKIRGGQVPFPMYTCLHVKSNVSAKIFQEWYEFTPYEVGIPKYGIYFPTSHFASKFFMGHRIKCFPEVRLHFLYGIWGSAFTIQFKRLLMEKGRNGQSEILKILQDKNEEDFEEEEDFISAQEDHNDDAQLDSICDPISSSDDNERQEVVLFAKKKSFFRQYSLPKINKKKTKMTHSKTLDHFTDTAADNEAEEQGRWDQLLEKALTTSPIDSRAFRAGVIWNPIRGLTFKPTSGENNVEPEGMVFAEHLFYLIAQPFLCVSKEKESWTL